VVGAGPAGLYALQRLLGSPQVAAVDVLDALPAPYGLVRYGVAPDHPRTRRVAAALALSMQDSRVRFLGNVTLGRDVHVAELQARYDAVVLATGLDCDRLLGIPGEDLPGSYGAAGFVAWYNARPDLVVDPLPFRPTSSAVVVGGGNVALDIARMLALGVADLATTDVPDSVLQTFANSRVEDIHVLVRRGLPAAKFSGPELREIGELDDVDIVVDQHDVEALVEGPTDRAREAMIRLFGEWAERSQRGASRRVHFHFHAAPVAIGGGEQVESVTFTAPRTAGGSTTLPAGLVVRAIGYRGRPIPGVPFDPGSGVIPSKAGQVLDGAQRVPGLYVVGWAKRGPSGVIGSNRPDAAETVDMLLQQWSPASRSAHPEPIEDLLHTRGVSVVDWPAWRRLESHEQALGAKRGAESVKVGGLASCLAVCGVAESSVRRSRRC